MSVPPWGKGHTLQHVPLPVRHLPGAHWAGRARGCCTWRPAWALMHSNTWSPCRCHLCGSWVRWCWDNSVGWRWSCSCSSVTSSGNLDNFYVSVNTPLIPKHQANSGLCTYFLLLLTQTRMTMWPQPDIFYFLFFVLCSLSYKSFLHSAPLCILQMETVCFMMCWSLYHLNCLL